MSRNFNSFRYPTQDQFQVRSNSILENFISNLSINPETEKSYRFLLHLTRRTSIRWKADHLRHGQEDHEIVERVNDDRDEEVVV